MVNIIWFVFKHSAPQYNVHRVMQNLEPIPGDSGQKVRGTLDGVPTHCRSQIHTFTHYGRFRDADQPTLHAFGLGWKPEYPDETPRRNYTHKGWRQKSNPTLKVWSKCAIIPPCFIYQCLWMTKIKLNTNKQKEINKVGTVTYPLLFQKAALS